MMESQETHSVSEGPSRCPGSWWKTCFKQPSWVQKKMSNYPGLSRGLNWRKGNTELWRWWWSWQWAKGWPWWRTWGPQSLNHCCWIASYLCTLLSWWFHPFPNNSHMSMTPNYHHRPSPPPKMDRYSVWVPTKIQCLKLIITILNHSSQCLYSVRSCFWS